MFNYIKGENRLNVSSLRDYLEYITNNDQEVLSNLNKAILELARLNIVIIHEDMSKFAIINDETKLLGILAKNRQFYESVASFVDEFHQNEHKTNKIARAYDMMIDPDAVEMYRERERQEMEKEYLAHAYYHGHRK